MGFFANMAYDIKAVRERDPAARSGLEVFLTYPGFHAITWHRLAHGLWNLRLKLLARMVSAFGRFVTGIEIHPGAKIGRGVFIDHGTGVVIGETAEVGDNCTLYQGVTLGGTSLDEGKRHPTLEDGVIVGAGAQVLGPFTVGKNARIGSNAVVVKEVAPDVTMVGVLAKPSSRPGKALQEFYAYGTPVDEQLDPLARSLEGLMEQLHGMDLRIKELEGELQARDDRLASLLADCGQDGDEPEDTRT